MEMKGKDLAKKVKELLKKGLTWTEVAKELHLPESTVRWYAKTYLNKK